MTAQLEIIDLPSRTDADETEIVEIKKMESGLHSVITMRIGRVIANYVEEKNLGNVLDSSATYNFKDGQPKRQPDVSFVSLAKMPVPVDSELTVAPDLAVEVVSKNDKDTEIEAKVRQYQQVQVPLIWIVRPFSQSVEVYWLEDGVKSQKFVGDDELEGGQVLPGFKALVKSFFV